MLRKAVKGWTDAQAQFETAFGAKRTEELRALLHAVSTSDLAGADAPAIND